MIDGKILKGASGYAGKVALLPLGIDWLSIDYNNPQTPVYFEKENAQAAMGLQMAFAYSGVTLMPPLFGQLFARVSFSLMPYVLLICDVGLLACTARLAAISKKNSAVQE